MLFSVIVTVPTCTHSGTATAAKNDLVICLIYQTNKKFYHITCFQVYLFSLSRCQQQKAPSSFWTNIELIQFLHLMWEYLLMKISLKICLVFSTAFFSAFFFHFFFSWLLWCHDYTVMLFISSLLNSYQEDHNKNQRYIPFNNIASRIT